MFSGPIYIFTSSILYAKAISGPSPGLPEVECNPSKSEKPWLDKDENLMMFDEYDQKWKLFKGPYKVMVGSSSRDICVTGEIIID